MANIEVSVLELYQHRRRKAFSLAGKTNNELRGRPKYRKADFERELKKLKK